MAAPALGPNTGTGHSSANPATSGDFRADDDEVHVLHARGRRVLRDARVAGVAEHLRLLRRAQERADDRVLAAPAADDQNFGQSAAMKSSIGIAISVS